MVFSSIPAYLDPSNWQQQPQHHHHQQNQGNFHHGISSINPILTNPNPLLPPPPLPPQQPPRAQLPPNMGPMPSSSGSIRPGSMAERARMANIPMPEMALKCPRCESTNTKFCYFNNYSLSQPRHFCKTCRRYWTRGGALRSVPVGGGCRRNKRSKSSSSSKSAASDRSSSAPATSSATSGMSVGGSGPGGHSSVAEMMGLTSSLRFMSPLHHLTDFGDQLGLSNYTGIPTAGESSFHLSGPEQWRIPAPNQTTHFPFLGGLDGAPGSSLYGHPFEGVEFSSLAIGGTGGPLRAKAALEAGGGSGQLADAVKMENGAVRRFNMGIGTSNQGNGEDNYNWGNGSNSSGNAWTDLSALNNSSCSTTSAL